MTIEKLLYKEYKNFIQRIKYQNIVKELFKMEKSSFLWIIKLKKTHINMN